MSPTLADGFFITEAPGKRCNMFCFVFCNMFLKDNIIERNVPQMSDVRPYTTKALLEFLIR